MRSSITRTWSQELATRTRVDGDDDSQWIQTFDDDLLNDGREKTKQTRSQR